MDESPVIEKKESMKFGPVVAITILILIFLIGGVYFFLNEKARFTTPPVQQTINT